MRLISFSLTKDQVRDRSKTVTRRLGWRDLKPGTVLRAVEKAQGLRKGETVVPLATIRVVNVRREPLRRLTDDVAYGIREVAAEGFCWREDAASPAHFVAFFCRSHKGGTPDTEVTRIQFVYVDEAAR